MDFLTLLPQRLDSGATPTFAGLLAGDGTNAAPSISFQSDPDTGLYLDAANTLGIATAGAGTVLFSSSAGVGKIKAHGTRVLALEAGTGNTNITLTPSGTGANLLGNNSLFSGTVNAGSAWRTGTIVLGGDGNDKVIAGPLISGTGGPAIGGHNTAVNGWTAFNILGSAIVLRTNGETEAVRIFSNQRVGIGTGTTDSGALLQLGTDTPTAAGGMVFGTNTQLYRSGEGLNLRDTTLPNVGIRLLNNSGGACRVQMDNTYQLTLNSESGSVVLKSAGTTALTLDSSQNATFAGTVKPQLATTAGAPAYVKGAIYFDTTLNKLRVGGATAWETITSV